MCNCGCLGRLSRFVLLSRGRGRAIVLQADSRALDTFCTAGSVAVSCCQCPSTSPSAIPSVLWEEGWSGHSVLLAEWSHSHCWLLFPLVALWKHTESRGSCLNYALGQNLFLCFVTDSVWVMEHGRSSTLVGNTIVSLSQNSLTGLQLAQIPGRAGLCAVCLCTVLTLALSSHLFIGKRGAGAGVCVHQRFSKCLLTSGKHISNLLCRINPLQILQGEPN